MDNKFQQGKNYKLINTVDDTYYIGSTAKKYLNNRLYDHKYTANNELFRTNSNLYEHMRKIGADKFDIELIEEYHCHSRQELWQREEFFINLLKNEPNCLNMRRAFVSNEENYKKKYYDQHKEEIKEYKKQYANQHKEEIKEYKKQYANQHKEEIKERKKQYYEQNKEELNEQRKQYYDQHKEEILNKQKHYNEQHKQEKKEYKKQYYEQRKDEIRDIQKQYREQYKEEINKQRKQKVKCICGSEIRKDGLKEHEISFKHQKYLKSNSLL